MRRRRLLALGLALPLAACSGQAPPVARSKESPMPVTVRYGSDPSQYGELSLPDGDAPQAGWPVVVVVHGGFWQSGYNLELGRSLAADLVTAGVAAWNIEYRRVGRGDGGGGGWPATGEDVAAAVDLLAGAAGKAADDRGGLDLDRVVGLGHSAGGQLVGWLAGRAGMPAGMPGADPAVPLSGVVPQAGCLDLVAAAELGLGGSATQAFLGGQPAEQPEAYDQASPVARLPTGIPVVCVHGSADPIVPISQSERYVAAATKAGDPARLHTVDGADHFDLITVGRPGWTACRTETLKLLGV